MNRRVTSLLEKLEKNLDPEDKPLLKKVLKMSEDEGELISLLQDLSKMDYERVPVDVETFLTHRDYLGLGGDRGKLWPGLLDLLIETLEGDYDEIYLDGGIGWGKSTYAECAGAWMLYQLSCLRRPQMFYNLNEDDTIAVLNVSVNKTQAKKVVYGRLKEKVKSSPYFREVFPFDPQITSELRFDKKNIVAMPTAASESGTIGYTVYGALMDEVNFMDVVAASSQNRGEKFDQAEHVHNLLKRRIKSRFVNRGGPVIAVSSSKYPDSFTERKRQEAREKQALFEAGEGPEPNVFVKRNAQWSTRPESEYSRQSFYLFTGTTAHRPFTTLDENEVEEFKEKKPESVLEVPMDFWDDFQTNLHGSIRDIAGIPTMTIKPFFAEMDKVMEAIKKGEDAGLEHPYTTIETTLRDGASIIPELIDFNKKHSYYVHADLALNGDAAGFAVGHVDGWEEVTRTLRKEDNTGAQVRRVVKSKAPVIVIDLMLRIKAPNEGEIQISDVRGLIMELRSLGCNIEKATYDQWQSVESIQTLNRQGIESETLSVDRTMEPYNALKEAAMEDRLVLYPYTPFIQEASRLERVEHANRGKGKVDHPPKGSKDVTDAVAGVCYHCAMEEAPVYLDPSYGGFTKDSTPHHPPHWKDPAQGKKRPEGRKATVDDFLFPDDDEDHHLYMEDEYPLGFA